MRILIIPSAAIIPPPLQMNLGKIPSTLVPYKSGVILDHICAKYSCFVDYIFVSSYYNHESLEEYVRIKKLNLEIVKLDKFGDIGYSVFKTLEYVFSKYGKVSQLYLNFGDTLTSNKPVFSKDIVLFSNLFVEDTWTYFKHDGGEITQVFDKVECDSLNKVGKVFVGEFGIAESWLFYSILSKNINSIGIIDSLYLTLIEYSQKYGFIFVEVENWVDVGHHDNSIRAKSEVEARAFNVINIDKNRGILKKTSNDAVKFVNEINWYLNIPNELQYMLPRIYDYSTNLDCPMISMEYYGYPTLHELFVYGKLSPLKWNKIFEKIDFIVSDMRSYTGIQYSQDKVHKYTYDMYITKPIERLQRLKNNDNFIDFFTGDVTLNGYSLPSLNECIDNLPSLIEEVIFSGSEPQFSIIHGDLCFTNILVETNYNFIRLIDPRGSFGAPGIYGDIRYDIAKLFHSIDGGYDYIIEDLVPIELDGTDIYCDLPCNKQNKLFGQFVDVFSNHIESVDEIRIIESTLFLSMLPLHDNVPSRQYAMLATGLELLNGVI